MLQAAAYIYDAKVFQGVVLWADWLSFLIQQFSSEGRQIDNHSTPTYAEGKEKLHFNLCNNLTIYNGIQGMVSLIIPMHPCTMKYSNIVYAHSLLDYKFNLSYDDILPTNFSTYNSYIQIK